MIKTALDQFSTRTPSSKLTRLASARCAPAEGWVRIVSTARRKFL